MKRKLEISDTVYTVLVSVLDVVEYLKNVLNPKIADCLIEGESHNCKYVHWPQKYTL